MRHSLIIFTIVSIFATIAILREPAQPISPPPASNTPVEVTLEGTLYQITALSIPGTSLPVSSYVVSANGFDFALDFSSAPQLASIAATNVNNKVRVRGALQLKTSETPAGDRIEWFVLEVFEISAI